MDERPQTNEREPEFVGAPASYADSAEVPGWLATATRALFFLPAAAVAAAGIPIVVIAVLLLGAALLCGLAMVLF
jgi:hypothetical protein